MFVNPSSAFVGKPSVVASSSGRCETRAVAGVVAVDEEELRVARRGVVEVSSRPVNVFGDIASSLRRQARQAADR